MERGAVGIRTSTIRYTDDSRGHPLVDDTGSIPGVTSATDSSPWQSTPSSPSWNETTATTGHFMILASSTEEATSKP